MPFGWKRRQVTDKIVSPSGTLVPVAGVTRSTTGAAGDVTDNLIYANQALRYTRSDLVYMCVNRVAEMAAMQATKLQLFDANSERDIITGWPTKPADEHPFMELWDSPNPWNSTFEFVEKQLITMQLNGNAYWHLDDGEKPVEQNDHQKLVERTKEPVALWAVRPDRLTIKPSATEYIDGYLYELDGSKIMFKPSAMTHFKRYHPLKDYEGLSPIEAANYASSSDLAAQIQNAALFKNGMRLGGVIESDRESVSPDQVRAMREYLKDTYTGDPSKAHQVAFLWQSFKYRDMGMNMRDIEFIEGTKLNRMRIFGIFGVHPAVILSEDVNRSNAEVGEYMTLKYTVAPSLERIAATMTMMINTVYEGGTENIEAHFEGVVPQDEALEAEVADKRARAVKTLIQALGPELGVMESQRQGLLDEKVDHKLIPPRMVPGVGFGVTDFDAADEPTDD